MLLLFTGIGVHASKYWFLNWYRYRFPLVIVAGTGVVPALSILSGIGTGSFPRFRYRYRLWNRLRPWYRCVLCVTGTGDRTGIGANLCFLTELPVSFTSFRYTAWRRRLSFRINFYLGTVPNDAFVLCCRRRSGYARDPAESLPRLASCNAFHSDCYFIFAVSLS